MPIGQENISSGRVCFFGCVLSTYLSKLKEYFLGRFLTTTGAMHRIIYDKIISAKLVHHVDVALGPIFFKLSLYHGFVFLLESGHVGIQYL